MSFWMQLFPNLTYNSSLPRSDKMISSQAIKEEEFQEFFKLADGRVVWQLHDLLFSREIIPQTEQCCFPFVYLFNLTFYG